MVRKETVSFRPVFCGATGMVGLATAPCGPGLGNEWPPIDSRQYLENALKDVNILAKLNPLAFDW